MYRDALGPVRIVLLDVPEAVARERSRARSGHYMPASLVASQYAALELPARDCRTLVFDGTLAPAALVDEIVGTIAGRRPRWRRSLGAIGGSSVSALVTQRGNQRRDRASAASPRSAKHRV